MKQILSNPLPRARVRHRRRPAPPKPSASMTAAPDLAAAKVREAGGPIDRAAYGCHCGHRFSASVSTTVSCPQCGAEQAW